MDSFCKYGDLKYDNRFTNAMIYAGGSLFNLASIFIVNLLIIKDIIPENIFSTSLFIFQPIMYFCSDSREIFRKSSI